jgi:hypothetical protein
MIWRKETRNEGVTRDRPVETQHLQVLCCDPPLRMPMGLGVNTDARIRGSDRDATLDNLKVAICRLSEMSQSAPGPPDHAHAVPRIISLLSARRRCPSNQSWLTIPWPIHAE